MKKAIILLFLTVPFFIFSEVILVKDGSLIKGQLIKTEENFVLIKSDYGELKIDKTNIVKIYFSEEEYKNDINSKKEENKTAVKFTKRDFKDNNADYKIAKRFSGPAIALVIVGSISAVCLGPLMIIAGVDNDLRNVGAHTTNRALVAGGAIFLSNGIIMDIISFVLFGQSYKYYSRYKEAWEKYSNSVSLNFYYNLNRDNINLALSFKL